MMISTLVDATPVNGAGRPVAAGSHDPARFSEFSLTPAPNILQTSLIHENPFCRLAQRTGRGHAICGKGCGMTDPSALSAHACPFGLRMIRTGACTHGQGVTQWLGRRFPSVDAMHNALDELLGMGLDEETILAHLPPNPIAGDEELSSANHEAPFDEAASPAKPVNVPADHESPEQCAPNGEDQILNMLEYVEQIQALLATAGQPAAVCERFLRVLAGMVPFEEMSIYLQDSATGQLVIAASVDQQSRRSQPLAHECRLAPESVGAQALAQRRMLIERDGTIEPVGGRMQGRGILAVPLPMRPGQPLGVWLAGREKDQYPSRLGSDPVRVMRLLVSILTMRLQQLIPGTGHTEEAEAAESVRPSGESVLRWNREALLGILEPEIARAAASGVCLALLRLHIACRGDMVALPTREIEEALRGALRPYDQMAMEDSLNDSWAIVMPLADGHVVTRMATRLIEVIEDQLDACGGTEEQGLWPAVGISIYGQDAAEAAQMIEHSGAALRLAGQAGLEEPIRMYADTLDHATPMARADHA